ncbi:LapA family protein [Saccharothrix obliqua]|uniref:LapA family protein n=1 Tax=Saccharothrix obliqua TaxID=2861747 RepID=UPI001C60046D|nr:LapA family protein [Saccharothrix obliqua]MBW4716928.1 hypothetical protein [Saccharothrix obliqua]
MIWLFAQLFVLCALAFLAGALITWLALRSTIRALRARLDPPVRLALTAVPRREPSEVERKVVHHVDTVPAPECAVKGSSKSMIFHTPDSPYFKRMKGDVTFRSIAEAERAGYTRWRPKSAASAR